MEISPVRMFIRNGLHCPKTPQSKVFLPIELNDKVYNTISNELTWMEQYAKASGMPIFFSPKPNSNTTLMNYGSFTTLIKNDDSEKQIVEQLRKHIRKD